MESRVLLCEPSWRLARVRPWHRRGSFALGAAGCVLPALCCFGLCVGGGSKGGLRAPPACRFHLRPTGPTSEHVHGALALLCLALPFVSHRAQCASGVAALRRRNGPCLLSAGRKHVPVLPLAGAGLGIDCVCLRIAIILGGGLSTAFLSRLLGVSSWAALVRVRPLAWGARSLLLPVSLRGVGIPQACAAKSLALRLMGKPVALWQTTLPPTDARPLSSSLRSPLFRASALGLLALSGCATSSVRELARLAAEKKANWSFLMRVGVGVALALRLGASSGQAVVGDRQIFECMSAAA